MKYKVKYLLAKAKKSPHITSLKTCASRTMRGELTTAIGGHPRTVLNVLKHLVDIGEIVKVRRAVYKLADR